MIYEVGEEVRFLNDIGGGVVRSLKGKFIVVEDEYGFERSVLPQELVKVHTEKKSELEKADIQAPIDFNLLPFASKGLFLGLAMPGMENPSSKPPFVYLLNDEPISFYFLAWAFDQMGDPLKMAEGKLDPGKQIRFDTSVTDIDFQRGFRIQAILRSSIQNDISKTMDLRVSIPNDAMRDRMSYALSPDKSFRYRLIRISIMPEEKEADFSLLLQKHMPTGPKAIDQNPLRFRATDLTNKKKEDDWVFDLHIEELLTDHTGMSNTEILNYQMDFFRKKIDDARMNFVHKVTFIHGIGTGVLKRAILEELLKEDDLKFEDGSYNKYGHGAIDIMIRR